MYLGSVLMQILLNLLDIASIIILGVATRLQFDLGYRENIVNLIPSWIPVSVPEDEKSLTILLVSVSLILLILKTVLSIQNTKFLIGRFSLLNVDVSLKLFAGLMRLPFPRLMKKSIFEINYIFSRGIEVLTIQLMATTLIFMSDLFLLIMLSILMFEVDIGMALSLVSGLGMSAGYMYYRTRNRATQSGKELGNYVALSEAQVKNSLSLFRELFVSSRLDYFESEFSKNRKLLGLNIKEAALIPYLNKYAIEIGLILCMLIFGFYQVVLGPVDDLAYKVTVFAAAGSRLIPSLLRVQQGAIQIKSNIGLAKNTTELIHEIKLTAFEELEAKVAMPDQENFVPDERFSVVFSNVEFEYPEGKFRLKDLNLTIPLGANVAIVGNSGVGKTTFADLMMGLLKPSKGTISIDGINPELFRRKHPEFISYVPQETYIFNGTVRENLLSRYHTFHFEDSILWANLASVQLDELIKSGK